MKKGIIDYTIHYNNGFHNIIFRWIDKAKIKILKKSLDGKNLKILDLGCGTGSIARNIKGCRIYGIDHNEALLKQAKANGLIVKKGKFENLPYGNNSFDAVISVDSAEHFGNRNLIFSEVKRVLKPNGEFMIFTPAYSSLFWVLAEKFINMITRIPSGHYSPFTKESLTYFMKQNFKQVNKTKYINLSFGLYAHARQKQILK